MSENAFHMRAVSKSYTTRNGMRVHALDGVSLDAPSGLVTCLVGPTGSGKSTILRILSGLETEYEGEALAAGADPSAMGVKTGYMTQGHALFPWKKVGENVSLPFMLGSTPRNEVRDRGMGILRALGLEGAENLYPYELSGGMRQRAALGKLIATEARVWLLDEPFINLDERTQHALQRLLLSLKDVFGLSVLFVTHSIDEAVFLADRILILTASPGKIADAIDVDIPHPRNRLAPPYGALMERIRQGIQSVIVEAKYTPPVF